MYLITVDVYKRLVAYLKQYREQLPSQVPVAMSDALITKLMFRVIMVITLNSWLLPVRNKMGVHPVFNHSRWNQQTCCIPNTALRWELRSDHRMLSIFCEKSDFGRLSYKGNLPDLSQKNSNQGIKPAIVSLIGLIGVERKGKDYGNINRANRLEALILSIWVSSLKVVVFASVTQLAPRKLFSSAGLF